MVVYSIEIAVTTDVTPLNGSCVMISSVGVAVVGGAVVISLLSIHVVECPTAVVGIVDLSRLRRGRSCAWLGWLGRRRISRLRT